MFYVSHILFGSALLLAVLYLQKLKDVSATKQFSIRFSWSLLFIAAIITLLNQFGLSTIKIGQGNITLSGPLPFLELFLCLVLIVSLSFASLKSHSHKAFMAIFSLMALTHFLFATQVFVVKLVVSIGGTLVTLWCFQASAKQDAKIFSLYQYSGLALLIAGLSLIKWAGLTQFGTGLVFLSIAVRQGLFPFSSAYTHFLDKAPFGLGFLFAFLHLGALGFWISELDMSHTGLIYALAIGGSITSVVAALMGLIQVKGRRSLSYLILSQSAFMIFAWVSTKASISSDLLMSWYSLSIATLGFSAMLHSVEARRGHLNLNSGSGNYAHTPKMAVACLLLGFASLGFPLTLGFSALEGVLQQGFASFPILSVVCALALAINSINVLRIFFFLFTGRRKNTYEPDLTSSENLAATFSMAVLFIGALAPYPIIAVAG